MGNELQIQFTGLSLEPVEPLLSEASFIMLHPFVHVLLAKFEHAVDQTGECVAIAVMVLGAPSRARRRR